MAKGTKSVLGKAKSSPMTHGVAGVLGDRWENPLEADCKGLPRQAKSLQAAGNRS